MLMIWAIGPIREKARIRTMISALIFGLVMLGCAGDGGEVGDAPFVQSTPGVAAEAPFHGPAERIADPLPATEPSATEIGAQPGTAPLPAMPSTMPAEIAVSNDPLTYPASTAADHRRQTWLTSSLRCKAISTTRLRRCRFEQTPDGYSIKFPLSDVTCNDVEFDENGDPQLLTGCRGAWLLVPKNNRLRPNRARTVWSGSHSGWRWRGDRQKYCCPGLWIEAPTEIQGY
jgi:hypothetical protein